MTSQPSSLLDALPAVDWEGAAVVATPPEPRAGSWAGGPSAQLVDGTTWLAYRLRKPVGEGRGFANVVARSSGGDAYEPVAEVRRESFGGDSLERPALVVTPEGGWRLYVSVALPGTKAWRVDLLEASSPEGLATAVPRTVLPATELAAPKDPVVRLLPDRRWHLWASVHPLDDPLATDRMTTEHAVSDDGVSWAWTGTALAPRAGTWEERGVRVSTVVVADDQLVALYDGRATELEDWEERTGVAFGKDPEQLQAVGDLPLLSSVHPPHGLRYVELLALPEGRWRVFAEVTRPDGSHDLRTTVL
ncbi:glycosyl hydrolase family 32 [Motilibacter rhizosphaerae]|uniref:Glycosyl hydrolase family 32 n=1 Tax=Motilibacter rhizosphaerae TaxID=598652 RepID=A0A4Q7NVQ5_9ACTN|nr:hypothetical protein [Motilibacter rhizosphaerae]RZS91353.1 glycosyl hydrolase family 32 [Motilibacter rhizosphaerae]